MNGTPGAKWIRSFLAFVFLALVIGSAVFLIVARERTSAVDMAADAIATSLHRAMW